MKRTRPLVVKCPILDIGTFLSRGPLNPEHQALLRLIAILVDE
jgi:hypothetical protein